ncbi:hypothetical protein SAMN05720473_10460 [Fibrobacter sp. UWB15]|nr:hypothetical protein BGW99_1114 [Fibrobacter sp. UWB6]SHG47506.1 hypothetical protein SAMN05720760_1124 [Fibrobacter sp. UWB8]SMG27978.1 hypothetical protein SAMN05720473_10460 [Fibrobacter sp. UWB15]
MGKIAKLFLICTLLLVGESFADLTRPLYFSCGKRTDDGVYACNIRQLESTKSTLQPQYTKWGEFLQVFQNRIEMDLGDPSAKTEYNGFEIIFESDIDLGGYQKTNGVVTCRDNTFAPMNFESVMIQPTIDGQNKTIKNFCYIAKDENASFFSSLSNSTVKDITFLNAYVKAKTVSAGNRCGSFCDASVVTDTAEHVAFENVAVKGAAVYGWQTSTLAITAKAGSTNLNTPAVSLSHVTIQDVNLSMTRDVIAEYSDAEYRYDSQSASGGVVANLRGHFKMDDSLKVLNLSAPDSISKVFKDVTNKEYVGNRYVGGIAGIFSPSAEDTDFTLDSIEVSADLSGLWVGGLFGRVSIDNDNLLGSSNFNVTNAKVTLNSPVYLGNTGGNRNRYFGGLVGEWIWLRGKVVLSNDTVDVSADWRGDKDLAGVSYMGGLAGFITGKEDGVSLVDVLAENNTVTAEMLTSSRNVYAGGILGRVNLEKDDIIGSGSLRILKSNVKAKKSNLITTTASEIMTVNASYLVGNAVSLGGKIEILRNHAEGTINIKNDKLSGSGAVGAEIGLGWSSGAYIYNNTSVGNLLVKKVIGNTMSLRITQGYVAGRLTGEDPDSKFKLGNNIHYGTSDMGVSRAVDTLKIAGQAHNASTWNKTYSSSVDVRYNYRNALKGDSALAADGSLKKNGSGEIIVNKNTGDSWYNGVIDADVMKSRLFTYVMNATQPSGSTVTWDNKPSFLPVISEKRTAYRLAISLLDEDYIQLTPADTAALRDYLPAEQCEARTGICSLYVYTENDLMLKSDLKSTFDGLKAGFMLIDKLSTDVSGRFDYNQKFTKDKTVNGLTDREIEVEYIMKDLVGANNYVSVDKYADNMTFVMPKVDKIRLISGKGAVPVMMLNTDDANGNAPEYQLDCNVAYNPCKAGMSLSECDENGGNFYVETTSKKMGTFEEVLKVVRKRYDDIHQNKIVLLYLPIELSQGNGTLPHIDVGLFKTKAKINMTTYAYNGTGALKEVDSRVLGDGIVTQSGVDMVSRYQFSLAERGFNVNAWKVDFWVDLEGKPIDAITQCYNEGSLTAKCAEANKYTDLSEKYFASENKIENVLNAALNGLIQNKPRLSMWSTVIDPNDSLSLDSMIYAMAVAIPTYAPKASVLIGVVPDLQVVSYTVNFDVDVGGKNVFLTDEFVIKDSYSRENDETAKLPEGLLATDACFTGWIENAENPVLTPSLKMDGTLLEVANPKDAGTFDLYGAWDAGCTVEKAEVLLKVVDKTGAEGNFGTVTLSQSYRNPGKEKVILKHDFVDGRLEVPTSAEPMTLHVTSTQTNKDYDLAQLTLKAPNGNDMPISLTPGDTSFKLEPRVGESYTLYAMFAGYIDVDVKVNRDDVIYGYESDKKTLHVVERGTTYLPKWVYTPAECVLGWSVSPDGVDYDRDSIASDDLTAKVTSEKAVYAVWGDADACVASADYRRFKLETEHGTVEIIEVNTVDGSEIKHSFAGDSTILLPQDYARSKWVVRGVPQKGYKLDSVVIDGRIKLVEGDELADSIQGYLPMKAYFSEYREPVVSPNGVVSLTPRQVVLSGTRNGNAMRLPIEWHVEQGAVAELRATLLDALGVEVKPLVDSVAGNGSLNWDVFPLLPGVYRVNVKMKSGSVDSVSYVTEVFTVSPEITVAPDTWQMVSLSDVDQSAIMWDADPAFYYWDESAEYGVVWKYQRYNGGAVKAQQGIWYNSLEGRALPLRRDVATGSNVQGAPQIVWEVNAGWNMVANPYGWRVVLPENVLSTFEMCKWTAESGFAPVTELEPYEAVWLLSDTKTPIGFAAEPSFDNPVNTGALQKAALAKATRESWTLQAVLSDAKGHRDSWNVLGVGEANERLEPPAGMGDFVNLSVVEGKKALLKSIKGAEDDRHEWNLALSATTDRVGYLKFEGVKALNEMGLKVYVTIDGKTTEMGAGDSLKVLLKAAGSMATVQVTSSAVTTVASKLENLRFARVPGALQVGFDVSSDLAGAGYRVQLVDFKGRVAATYSAKSTAGHNTLALTAPKPGLYLLRVTLGRHHAVRKVAIYR